MRLLGVDPKRAQVGDALNSDELRAVVNEAGNMIPASHQEMLVSILDLEKVTVEDVMIPRNEIVGIDINDEWSRIIKKIEHAQHTRVLLYRNDIDDAVGFLHARDVMRLMTKNQFEADKATLVRAARDIYFIPEGTPLNVQLLKFQRRKERIGLVVDEYGDIQGLVTLEDILEEIVGDFTTSMAPQPSETAVAQPDGSYLVEGAANLRELNKEMNWQFPTDGPKTLSGLIIEQFGDIPSARLSLRLGGYPVELIEVGDTMIKQVRVLPQHFQEPRSASGE